MSELVENWDSAKEIKLSSKLSDALDVFEEKCQMLVTENEQGQVQTETVVGVALAVRAVMSALIDFIHSENLKPGDVWQCPGRIVEFRDHLEKVRDIVGGVENPNQSVKTCFLSMGRKLEMVDGFIETGADGMSAVLESFSSPALHN